MTELFVGPTGPLIIFFMRIADVSLATVRMLLIVRKQRFWVPLIGFAEVLIWVVAVGSAIQHLDSAWHVVGYAGGFAAGNWVGLWLEDRLAFGLASIQVFSRTAGGEVAKALRSEGHGVTQFAGTGREGGVDVVFSVVQRRAVSRAMSAIEEIDPGAFVTLGEPTAIHRGWLFPKRRK